MMCADFDRLGEEAAALTAAGADMLHIDIMDGRFVPSFGMGIQDLACVKRNTSLPVDVHLMIVEPRPYLPLFCELGADVVYVHPEGDLQPARTLDQIRALGRSPGIAVNPGTSAESVRELLPLCDWVLAMTVNPGFAGQAFLDHTVGKLQRLAELKTEHPFRLIVDGAISPARVDSLSAMGVDGFVLGTSALFGRGPYADVLTRLRG